MKRINVLFMLVLLLAACSGGGRPAPAPIPSASYWTPFYSKNIAYCDNFDFGELHYCVKQQPARLGQTIRMTFTISGTGTLYAPGDNLPVTIRLFIWRRGDDMTGVGVMENYRLWASRTEIPGPGTYTVIANLTSENWTGIYGKSIDYLFQEALNDPQGIGFSMGGRDFAGHGVGAYGYVHFTLNSYEILDTAALRRRWRKLKR